jgi:hypothetical protein
VARNANLAPINIQFCQIKDRTECYLRIDDPGIDRATDHEQDPQSLPAIRRLAATATRLASDDGTAPKERAYMIANEFERRPECFRILGYYSHITRC